MKLTVVYSCKLVFCIVLHLEISRSSVLLCMYLHYEAIQLNGEKKLLLKVQWEFVRLVRVFISLSP